MHRTSPRRPSRAVVALASGVAVGAVALGGVATAATPGAPSAPGAPTTSTVVVNPETSPVPVKVTNPHVTQEVTGTVNVGNLPATQEISGTVGLSGPVTVDSSTPLRVQEVGSQAVVEPFVRRLDVMNATDGQLDTTWTVPEGKIAQLEMLSVLFSVPQGAAVTGAWVSVDTSRGDSAGGTFWVPLTKASTQAGRDIYLASHELSGYALPGQHVTIAVGRVAEGKTAFTRTSLVGRMLPAS